MANVKTDKKVIPPQTGGSENNAATAPENATGGAQVAPENTEQGGANASEQKNPGVDKGSKETTTGAKRVSVKEAGEAKKIFKKFPVEELFFTADGFGFLTQQEAKYHAGSLQDQEVKKITKKDVE